MHQHPRRSPARPSSTNSPKTRTGSSSNARAGDDGDLEHDKGTQPVIETRVSSAGTTEAVSRPLETSVQSKESLAKLSQVVQNYFTKAALIILHARTTLPPAYAKDSRSRRINKWFNVEVDETDILREDLRTWRACDTSGNRPPPMVIETYIDTSTLTSKQSLLVVDEQGTKWDVEEALNASPSSPYETDQASNSEVVLERWVIQLGEAPTEQPKDLTPVLPRTYKNSIVLFRSLYACARLLPAWRFAKKLISPRPSQSSPKMHYRIVNGNDLAHHASNDPLSVPLYAASENVLEKFAFDPVDSPAGAISIQTTYRSQCDFQIEDSEHFLSSRFMGMDEQSFEPSLGRRNSRDHDAEAPPGRGKTEVGSLPPSRAAIHSRPDHSQAYGSMSTFHQVGAPRGTSPMSALRNARVAGSESPEDTAVRKVPPNIRSAQGSRSSLRSADGVSGTGRRPSVSFMPFKTPSLSASPSQNESISASIPRGSLGKSSPLAALVEARNPAGLSPNSRNSSSAAEPGVPSAVTSSPRPSAPQRFSSSFGHRKAKLSTGGSSKTEDDNSSGRASAVSSNAQPGSGVLAGDGGSSGSLQTDDDNISDFLKLLDQKKDLKSFRASSEGTNAEASAQRTNAALNRFQRMRDSNAVLSESLSSSQMLQRSSSTSSRQLSNVPAMVAATSMSVSTSPGKAASPHTPHTPAIPSRLSANSTVEYPQHSDGVNDPDSHRHPHREREIISSSARDPSTGAINIPTSPRSFHPSYRRSSSVVHGRAVPPLNDEDEAYPFRSHSLGVDEERAASNLSTSAAYPITTAHEPTETASQRMEVRESVFGPMFETHEASTSHTHGRTDSRNETGSSLSRAGPYRPRIGRGSHRGETPPQGSSSSLVERGSGSGSSDNRVNRYSRPASNFEDDEPLLFAMSEVGATQQSRRSLEELQGGESGSSSRRGSRRGGF